jgi:hypothetical protein
MVPTSTVVSRPLARDQPSRPRRCSPGLGGSDDGQALDLDQGVLVPQAADADAGHRGVVGADQPAPDGADLAGVRAVVGHVDDEDGQAGQLVGLAAGSTQGREQVAERLLELRNDAAADDAALGVHGRLAGQEDDLPLAGNRVREAARPSQLHRVDPLEVAHAGTPSPSTSTP